MAYKKQKFEFLIMLNSLPAFISCQKQFMCVLVWLPCQWEIIPFWRDSIRVLKNENLLLLLSSYLFFRLLIYGLSFPVCWLTNNGDRTELSQSDLFNHEYDYRLISTTRSSVTNLWYFRFLKIKIQEIPRDFLARREIKAINWVRAMARTVLLHCSITYRN